MAAREWLRPFRFSVSVFVLSACLWACPNVSRGQDYLAPAHEQIDPEELRARAHLEVLREMGHDLPESQIAGVHYTDIGHLSVTLRKPGFGGAVTFRFQGTKLFELDGGTEDLLMLVHQNHSFMPHASADAEQQKKLETLNAIREDIRYFAFKRIVKYREATERVRFAIEAFAQDAQVEPSARVREEAQVALRMIQGGTIEDSGKRLNIAFLTYEADPLIKKGGLADVVGSLPRVLQNKRGHNVSVFMPYWSYVDEAFKKNRHLEMKNTGIEFDMDGETVRVFSVVIDNTPVYLIKPMKARHFNVEGSVEVDGQKIPIEDMDIYREAADKAYSKNHPFQTHPVNARAAVFFSKAALEAMERLAWQQHKAPDIIVTADWQTGLVPALVKKSPAYKNRAVFAKTKLVHTIHNLAYKGMFKAGPDSTDPEQRALWESTGLPRDAYKPDNLMGVEAWDSLSLMKAGLAFADYVTTVSSQYALEIQTKGFGAGFHELFHAIRHKLRGILNGISRREWNPATAKELAVRMDNNPSAWDRKIGIVDLPEGKEANKAWLRSHYGLNPRTGERVPLISFAGRFDDQKGLHLMLPVVRELLRQRKAQFIFAGRGPDKRYENMLRELMAEFPGEIAYAGFAPPPQLKPILAGSDIVAMPSIFEPCGIVQFQAMRFGAIPLVNKVGGLANTVTDFSESQISGNGYVVDLLKSGGELGDYAIGDEERRVAEQELLLGFIRALEDFQDKSAWDRQVRQTFERSGDFSWDIPARQYENLFRELLGDTAMPGKRGLDQAVFERAA